MSKQGIRALVYVSLVSFFMWGAMGYLVIEAVRAMQRHASATEVALAIISVNECKLADMMTIDEKQLRAIITGEKTEVSPPELAKELLAARVKIGELERQLATPIRLPFSSASPVCEIEAGYAAGVSDCRQAIREAGFPIEGDDQRRLIEEKAGCHQRAYYQQYQDELKTIASQHSALQKKTALKQRRFIQYQTNRNDYAAG